MPTENPETEIRSGYLTRKEVCTALRWSRTTLWRRECEGLCFAEGKIAPKQLLEWVDARRIVTTCSNGLRPRRTARAR